MPALLEVDNISLDIKTENGNMAILRDISFSLARGETLGMVGESGSGKTVTCLSLLRLISEPPAIYRSGSVRFAGEDLWQMSQDELKKIRGRRIAMIFQEAQSSLNPILRIGDQVAEAMILHLGLSLEQARQAVIRLFERVGLPDADQRFKQYPHQLSGGMQQRVMIAMALACKPDILIADEPTTALDVTIQVQIIALLKSLQREFGMALIFISHDLGVIAEICQRAAIMYAGQIVEVAPIDRIFSAPQHPYTRMLLRSIPSIQGPRGRFEAIPGQIPSPNNLPPGCAFNPRCPECIDHCRVTEPELIRWVEDQQVRCHLRKNGR